MKVDEIKCWEAVCEDVPEFQKFIDISGDNQERPDMIFEHNGETIGVEHFLADTIMLGNGKKSQSNARNEVRREHSLKEKYSDYIDDPNLCQMSLPDVTAHMNENIDNLAQWNYRKFCDNFKRVYSEHIKKSENYEHTDKLYFLIEIPVPIYNWGVVENSGKLHEQVINGLPMTKDIWDIINKFDQIDKVILFTCQNNNGSSVHYTQIYDKQHVPSTIYRSFKIKKYSVRGNTEHVIDFKVPKQKLPVETKDHGIVRATDGFIEYFKNKKIERNRIFGDENHVLRISLSKNEKYHYQNYDEAIEAIINEHGGIRRIL